MKKIYIIIAVFMVSVGIFAAGVFLEVNKISSQVKYQEAEWKTFLSSAPKDTQDAFSQAVNKNLK